MAYLPGEIGPWDFWFPDIVLGVGRGRQCTAKQQAVLTISGLAKIDSVDFCMSRGAHFSRNSRARSHRNLRSQISPQHALTEAAPRDHDQLMTTNNEADDLAIHILTEVRRLGKNGQRPGSHDVCPVETPPDLVHAVISQLVEAGVLCGYRTGADDGWPSLWMPDQT